MTVNQMISGVVVFEADTAPKRIAARYFETGTVLAKREAQIAFEKDLISKAVKSCASLSGMISSVDSGARKTGTDKDAKPAGDGGTPVSTEHNEVVLVDNFIVVLRLSNDVLIAVIARDSQNDLLVAEYLNTLHTCLAQVCGGKISKKKCFDRLDQLFLVIDESIENGVVFEYDANTIVSRINMVSEPVEGAETSDSSRQISASMRQGIAAIRSGDTESLRSVFAGAAQSFSSFLGR
jgi:hypothetical protein